MNHPDLDYDQVLSTQEDIFMGSQGAWVPPLNFQTQIEHGKPFWESMRKKINFEPLVKETPFEKERKLKNCTKETQMLPTKEITIVETESPPIRRVVFHDDRVAGRSLTGLNTSASRIEQNRLVTSVREVSQEKDAKQKPPLKGILKSRNASKYWRQCSSQSSSQHSRIITTQLSGSPKDLNFSYREKERKMSTFSKFHDFHSRYIESENDEQSEDESFKRSNSQYSEENLDPLIEFYKSNGWGTSKNTQVQKKFKY